MTKRPTGKLPDDERKLPPFTGFPPQAIEFLKKLRRNNNRPWFERHREEYELFVRLPMLALLETLQPHLESFAPEFDADPKRSMFRIYRDVRFSKDKSPYKTHVAAHIVARGRPKGVEGLGYYIHVEPGEVFLGAGIYMPEGDQARKIREGIATHQEECNAPPKSRQIFLKVG